MNIKNMSISLAWPKLIVEYDCGMIVRTELDEVSGDIKFFHKNQEIIVRNVPQHILPGVTYLKQFGISITSDGAYFFIQSWEKGLFCFEVQTGCLVWHCKIKRAYNLVVLKDCVICHFLEQSVCVLDLSTGEIRHRVPFGFDTYFYPLTDDFYLVGPKRYMYHVVDRSLKTVARIPTTAVNPNAYDHFIMLRADIDLGGICISGFEHPPVVGREPPPEQCRFSRCVPVDIPGLTT